MKYIKLASIIDDICTPVSTKSDDNLSVENSMPNISSNISRSVEKLAMLVRQHKTEITYEDIEEALRSNE